MDCPVCMERFKLPQLLECGHSVCLACLVQTMESVQIHHGCAVCRKPALERPRLNRTLMELIPDHPDIPDTDHVIAAALNRWWPQHQQHQHSNPSPYHTDGLINQTVQTVDLCAAADDERTATHDAWGAPIQELWPVNNSPPDAWRWWETNTSTLNIPGSNNMVESFRSLGNGWALSPFAMAPYFDAQVLIRPGRRAYILASSCPTLIEQVTNIERAVQMVMNSNCRFRSEIQTRNGHPTLAVYDHTTDVAQSSMYVERRVRLVARGVWSRDRRCGVRWHIMD